MELREIVWESLASVLSHKLKQKGRVLVPRLGCFICNEQKQVSFEPATDLLAKPEPRPVTSFAMKPRTSPALLTIHQLNLSSYSLNDLKEAFESKLKDLASLVRAGKGELAFGSFGSLVAASSGIYLRTETSSSKASTQGSEDRRALRTPSVHSIRSSSKKLPQTPALHHVVQNHAKLALLLQSLDDT